MPAPSPKKPSPDPYLQRLRDIYNEAAARAPEEARPKFQRVANTFDIWIAATETGDREVTARKKADFSLAWDHLKNYCDKDREAYRVFVDMSERVLAVTKEAEEQKAVPPVAPRRKRPRHYDI